MSQENGECWNLKAVEKNSKNMSLKMCNISQVCNINYLSGLHRKEDNYTISQFVKKIQRGDSSVQGHRVKPRRDRNGNFSTGSHPASLLAVFNRGNKISEFFCNVKRTYMLAVS